MTNGELFIKENPTVEIKINGSCVWIYFDGVNHYTMPALWWEQEISLFDKIRAEIDEIQLSEPIMSTDGLYCYGSKSISMGHFREKVIDIIDKYRERSE